MIILYDAFRTSSFGQLLWVLSSIRSSSIAFPPFPVRLVHQWRGLGVTTEHVKGARGHSLRRTPVPLCDGDSDGSRSTYLRAIRQCPGNVRSERSEHRPRSQAEQQQHPTIYSESDARAQKAGEAALGCPELGTHSSMASQRYCTLHTVEVGVRPSQGNIHWHQISQIASISPRAT